MPVLLCALLPTRAISRYHNQTQPVTRELVFNGALPSPISQVAGPEVIRQPQGGLPGCDLGFSRPFKCPTMGGAVGNPPSYTSRL